MAIATGDPDLLTGHRAIGAYLGMTEREARHLCSIAAVPTFKLPGSSKVRARRSTLDRWLAEREAAAMAGRTGGGEA